jgi:hypothetical protein
LVFDASRILDELRRPGRPDVGDDVVGHIVSYRRGDVTPTFDPEIVTASPG